MTTIIQLNNSQYTNSPWYSYKLLLLDEKLGNTTGILFPVDQYSPVTTFTIQHFTVIYSTNQQFWSYAPYRKQQFHGNLNQDTKNFLAHVFIHFHSTSHQENTYNRLLSSSLHQNHELIAFLLPWTLNTILDTTLNNSYSSLLTLTTQFFLDFQRQNPLAFNFPVFPYIKKAIHILLQNGFIWRDSKHSSSNYDVYTTFN